MVNGDFTALFPFLCDIWIVTSLMKQLHALPCPADYVPLALMLPKRKPKHLIDIRICMQNRALNIPILPTDVNRSVADYTYSVQMTVLPFLRLWTIISAIAAVAPKLPSIWNGGCMSNRLGYVDDVNSLQRLSYAASPSQSLA